MTMEELTDTQLDDTARIAADFVRAFLMSQHRGVLDCGDQFVVFGNDGYAVDERSRREVEIVLDYFKNDSPIVDVGHDGYSWAVVVTDYQRKTFDADLLTKMVWNAWMTACDEASDCGLTGQSNQNETGIAPLS